MKIKNRRSGDYTKSKKNLIDYSTMSLWSKYKKFKLKFEMMNQDKMKQFKDLIVRSLSYMNIMLNLRWQKDIKYQQKIVWKQKNKNVNI